MPIADVQLGCVTFGREIDKERSFRLMDYAVQQGIYSFDTAAAYGAGASERIIGEWLSSRKDKGKFRIATKVLPPFDRKHLFESVENCRQRLGTQSVRLLYLHRWESSLLESASWEPLARLVEQGIINQLGVSNFNYHQLKLAIEALKKLGLRISYLQNNHNLAVSDITEDIRELCSQNNIKIVTYSPLGAGFLTGKHLHGVMENSRFDILPTHQDIYFNNTAKKKLNKLLEISCDSGYSPELLAMAWAIRQPFVHSVLVGGRSIEQLNLVFKARILDEPQLIERLENDCFRLK